MNIKTTRSGKIYNLLQKEDEVDEEQNVEVEEEVKEEEPKEVEKKIKKCSYCKKEGHVINKCNDLSIGELHNRTINASIFSIFILDGNKLFLTIWLNSLTDLQLCVIASFLKIKEVYAFSTRTAFINALTILYWTILLPNLIPHLTMLDDISDAASVTAVL